MHTYLTAVGTFYEKDRQMGIDCPVIEMAGQTYHLTSDELLLWYSTLWDFHTRESIIEKFDNFSGEMKTKYIQLLDRLINRGLIAVGEGNTDVEALQNLIQHLLVKPFKLTISNRFKKAVILLVLKRDLSAIMDELFLFGVNSVDRKILKTAGKNSMNVIEITEVHGLETNEGLLCIGNLYLNRLIQFNRSKVEQ